MLRGVPILLNFRSNTQKLLNKILYIFLKNSTKRTFPDRRQAPPPQCLASFFTAGGAPPYRRFTRWNTAEQQEGQRRPQFAPPFYASAAMWADRGGLLHITVRRVNFRRGVQGGLSAFVAVLRGGRSHLALQKTQGVSGAFFRHHDFNSAHGKAVEGIDAHQMLVA